MGTSVRHLVFFTLLLTCVSGRPWGEDTISNNGPDLLERFEVFVPSPDGGMTQQFMTLSQMRRFLGARDLETSTSEQEANVNPPHVVSGEVLDSVPGSPVNLEDKPEISESEITEDSGNHAEESLENLKQESPEHEVPNFQDPSSSNQEEATTETTYLEPIEDTTEIRSDRELGFLDPSTIYYQTNQESDQGSFDELGNRPMLTIFDPVAPDSDGLAATSRAQTQELELLSSASNNMAWKVWNNIVQDRSFESNQVFSPLALTQALGIVSLGARGSSADALNTLLRLDSVTSYNPHSYFRRTSGDLDSSEYFRSSISHTVYLNDTRDGSLDTYKARIDTQYGAKSISNPEEINESMEESFNKANDPVRIFTGQDDLGLRPPLSIFSSAAINVEWPVKNQLDEELVFLKPDSEFSSRKITSTPAVSVDGEFYAGYDPDLDATTVALPLHPSQSGIEEQYFSSLPDTTTTSALEDAGHLSLLLLMPGEPTSSKTGGASLAALEAKLASNPDKWTNLLTKLAKTPLNVQFPQVQRLGAVNLGRILANFSEDQLDLLFDPEKADFSGIAGTKNLYLADLNQFVELNISSVAVPEYDSGDTLRATARQNNCKQSVSSKNQANKKVAAASKRVTTTKPPSRSKATTIAKLLTTRRPVTTTAPIRSKTTTTKRPNTRKPATTKRPVTRKPATTTSTTTKHPTTKAATTLVRKVATTRKPAAKKKNSQPTKQTAGVQTSNKQTSKITTPVAKKPKQNSTTATTNNKKQQVSQKAPAAVSKTPAKATQNAKPANSKTSSTTTPKPKNRTTKQPAKLATASKPASKPAANTKQATNSTKKAAAAKPVSKQPATGNKQASNANKQAAKKQQPQTSNKQSASAISKPSATKTKNPSANKQGSKPNQKVAPAKQQATKQPAANKTSNKNSTQPANDKLIQKAQPTKQNPKQQSTKQQPANKTSNKQTAKPNQKLAAPAKQQPTKQTPKQQTSKQPTANKTSSKNNTRPATDKLAQQKTKPQAANKTSNSRPVNSKPANGKPVKQVTKQASSGSKNSKKKVATTKNTQKSGRDSEILESLVFNRSFLYAIRHNPTGLLMYIGRYVQP